MFFVFLKIGHSVAVTDFPNILRTTHFFGVYGKYSSISLEVETLAGNFFSKLPKAIDFLATFVFPIMSIVYVSLSTQSITWQRNRIAFIKYGRTMEKEFLQQLFSIDFQICLDF